MQINQQLEKSEIDALIQIVEKQIADVKTPDKAMQDLRRKLVIMRNPSLARFVTD
ncbi:MAG: hypothetical protein HC888_03390 [Candidatus Competibacteraceae bacterium]|nr:hypothetical protein [Candidatus Competibacteraceae bacterium]